MHAIRLYLVLAASAGVVVAGMFLSSRFAARAGEQTAARPADGSAVAEEMLRLETTPPMEPVRESAENDHRRPTPSVARDLPALTAELRIRAGTRLDVEAVLVREKGRIALVFPTLDREWYFERNEVNRRRFTGSAIDHVTRTILDFSDFDLSIGWIDGWESAAHVGLVPSEFRAALRATEEERSAFGLSFRKYVRRAETAGATLPVELWWNDDASVPLRIVWRVDGEDWMQETTALERIAEPGRMVDPGLRHPDYYRVDSCDACGSCNGFVGHSPAEQRLISPSAFRLLARGLPGKDGHAHHACTGCTDHAAGEPDGEGEVR